MAGCRPGLKKESLEFVMILLGKIRRLHLADTVGRGRSEDSPFVLSSSTSNCVQMQDLFKVYVTKLISKVIERRMFKDTPIRAGSQLTLDQFTSAMFFRL